MATVRKRPSPRGHSVYQTQIIRSGIKPQYRTFDTKAEAESWARRVESEMDSGRWQDRSEGDRTTVAQGFQRYRLEISPHKAETTALRETWKIRHLVSGLGDLALSRVTGRDTADYIRARERAGASPATIAGELSVLGHLYRVACGAWGMTYLTNPVPLAATARPKLPPGRERRLRAGLDGGEEKQILATASPEFGAVIRFALATAMRRGELASLRWEQVQLGRRCLVLESAKTKTRKARTIPLSPAALEVLRSLPRRIDGSVFGMSTNAIKLAWHRVIQRTGILDLHFHDLRHEAISRLFEDTDLDIMEIRAISGHKTLQMLARYTHLRTTRLADRLAGASRIK